MDLTSLTDADKAELNTRLLSIDVVSWQWNDKGLAIHKDEGHIEKLKNEPEIGVIAQTIQDTLHDLFPNIILIHTTGALMVNYRLLGEIAELILYYLDNRYGQLSKKLPVDLHLPELLKKYATADVQLYATRLLALVKLYNQKIDDKVVDQFSHTH